MYKNQYDTTGKCSVEGDSSEKRFDIVIDSMGGVSKLAPDMENIFDHIDRYAKLGENIFSVDIKAAKRTKRSGDIQMDEIWVEFLNVHGKAGWLQGKQDFIAFELEDYNFLLISRKELLKFCVDNIEKEVVDNPGDALYKMYRRSGRKDLISRIKVEDVKKLKHIMLKKEL